MHTNNRNLDKAPRIIYLYACDGRIDVYHFQTPVASGSRLSFTHKASHVVGGITNGSDLTYIREHNL